VRSFSLTLKNKFTEKLQLFLGLRLGGRLLLAGLLEKIKVILKKLKMKIP
jgi:hypothetical protein